VKLHNIWLKDKELCLGQGYIYRLTTKMKDKLKGVSKGINMKHRAGYLAMWLKIFNE